MLDKHTIAAIRRRLRALEHPDFWQVVEHRHGLVKIRGNHVTIEVRGDDSRSAAEFIVAAREHDVAALLEVAEAQLREQAEPAGASFFAELEEGSAVSTVPFRQHLEEASTTVREWPLWKQNILGGASETKQQLEPAVPDDDLSLL